MKITTNKPLIELRNFSRRAAQEGIVLLENTDSILPLINKKVAFFGRIQTNYYKSGTGSGGLVNVTDVPSFLDAGLENPRLDLNENFIQIYDKWIKDNPFNAGNGFWASEPWSQEEMSISEHQIKENMRSDETPIMFIGRTAGEDRDNFNGEGSYLLTKTEEEVIKNIKTVYGKIIIVLNVGNVIDMNYFEEIKADAVIYAWHGGQDGARATLDVITGYISPSGKLPSTIFKDIKKYPASDNFAATDEVIYHEDIYVGYRYSETFAAENVSYPFGYGLSYTTFDVTTNEAMKVENDINVSVNVKNKGNVAGKEVVQVYVSAPNGKLGKPNKQLIAFSKTRLLSTNEQQEIQFKIDINSLASYDDFGFIEKSAYVLEKGEYQIFVGTSVRQVTKVFNFTLEEDVICEKYSEVLAPVKAFKRLKNVNGTVGFEDAPLRQIDLKKRIKNNQPKAIKQTTNNYSLLDVYNKKISINEFIATLSDDDLMNIIMGEGMSSPKVTSGTASAFGGITDSLLEKDIAIICCSDGPSGVRMDSGGIATSLPNGTMLASSFNTKLIEMLYELEGFEMRNYSIDILLGPGLNIQRHPLNGRNFEYFSEDPLLTGKMASSVIKGLNKAGVFGSLKHYIANNQETNRTVVNSIISERALREIYLKGFEIAVKESNANVIMTSYNPINGIWAASNYDLNTTVLRKEWGFKGIVMTDWWAQMNADNDAPSRENTADMIKAQNDLYMVVVDVLKHKHNIREKFLSKYVSRAELQRSAKNILNFIIKTPRFKNSNDIKVKSLRVSKDKWFKVLKDTNKIPYLTNSTITDYERKITKKELTKLDLVETKKDITYGLLKGSEQTLYTFGVKPNILVENINDVLLPLINKTPVLIDSTFWKDNRLSLDNPVYKNEIASSDFTNISKDSMYSFLLDIKLTGKYIVALEIASNLPPVHQLPFSIYIDNVNKQTITSNGSNGEFRVVQSQIIIEEGLRFITFKFNKTGLNVKSINIIKHG